MPVKGEARSAKNEVQEVMRLLSRVVSRREERSVFMDIKVEDMTPVLRIVVSTILVAPKG